MSWSKNGSNMYFKQSKKQIEGASGFFTFWLIIN